MRSHALHALQVVGLAASLSDFQSYLSDPDFANNWNQVESQLTAEGMTDVGKVSNVKDKFLEAYKQLGDANSNLSSGDIATAAKDYVLTSQTVAGALNTIEGLVNTVQSAAPGPIVQAFTGTLIGSIVLTGALATGVGAAIVGAVSGLVAILQNAGLLSSPPLGQQICPNVYCYGSPFNVGCVCVNPDDPANPQIQPGSFNWRSFPEPGDPAAAGWFVVNNLGPANSSKFTWKGAGWATFCDLNSRPIDMAFARYHQLECELAESILASTTQGSWLQPGFSIGRPDPFLAAFFSAWKRNKEWALNGLKASDDALVLIHVLRLWNASHSNSTVTRVSPARLDPYNPGAPCGGVQSYVAMLVQDVQNVLGSHDPDVLDPVTGELLINSGDRKNPPVVTPLMSGTGTSSPVAGAVRGVAYAAGATAVGIGLYALATRQNYLTVARNLWKNTGGRAVKAIRRK